MFYCRIEILNLCDIFLAHARDMIPGDQMKPPRKSAV